MSDRIITQHITSVLDFETSNAMYDYMVHNVEWEEGIRSRFGPTRKAKSVQFGMDPVIDQIILTTLQKLGIVDTGIFGVYLNYYRNGNDYTPNHSHPGMKQVVISFGCNRTLKVGTKDYILCSGDVIIFGSAIHGVPRDQNCNNGRISIALFLEK